MIHCVDIVKEYHTERGKVRRILDNVNFTVAPKDRLAVLGRNGAGKSTLIKIIGRVEAPTSGHVEQTMSVSWPLAFGGAFQGSLTGSDNLRFICRIYNLDYYDTRAFVDDFAELGAHMAEPVKTYSSGMRARLAFALSLAIEFDCYLIDEVIVVGDARFHRRCHDELWGKRSDRALVIVSHDSNLIREVCTAGAVLENGHLDVCDTLEEAIQRYNAL